MRGHIRMGHGLEKLIPDEAAYHRKALAEPADQACDHIVPVYGQAAVHPTAGDTANRRRDFLSRIRQCRGKSPLNFCELFHWHFSLRVRSVPILSLGIIATVKYRSPIDAIAGFYAPRAIALRHRNQSHL